MSLPTFNEDGDLPPGVYTATLGEVIERFGSSIGKRSLCTQRLSHVYTMAQRSGHLQRFIIRSSQVWCQHLLGKTRAIIG